MCFVGCWCRSIWVLWLENLDCVMCLLVVFLGVCDIGCCCVFCFESCVRILWIDCVVGLVCCVYRWLIVVFWCWCCLVFICWGWWCVWCGCFVWVYCLCGRCVLGIWDYWILVFWNVWENWGWIYCFVFSLLLLFLLWISVSVGCYVGVMDFY